MSNTNCFGFDKSDLTPRGLAIHSGVAHSSHQRAETETRREPTFDEAFDAVNRWYFAEVREWAAELDRRIAEREWKDEEDFRESFDEETDGAQCIIYTAQAQAVVLASRHHDSYEDEFGEKPPTVEAQALMAFRADILEHMSTDLSEAWGES